MKLQRGKGQDPSTYYCALLFQLTRNSGETGTMIYKMTFAFECKNLDYSVAAIAKVLLVQNW